jgi:CcmD family protein
VDSRLRDEAMDERNFIFMFYGFAAAWTILAGYVVFLGTREGKLRRQLDNLKKMVDDREK